MGLAGQDWRAGYDAHAAGRQTADNPYRAHSPSSDDWLQGWRDAEQETRHGPTSGRTGRKFKSPKPRIEEAMKKPRYYVATSTRTNLVQNRPVPTFLAEGELC